MYRGLAWLLAAATCASIALAATKPLSYLGAADADVSGPIVLMGVAIAIALAGVGRGAYVLGRAVLQGRACRLGRDDRALVALPLAAWFLGNFAVLYSLDRSFLFTGGTTPFCHLRRLRIRGSAGLNRPLRLQASTVVRRP